MALLGLVPIVPQLFVLNDHTGDVILTHQIHPQDTFYVTYIHSVNKSKVTDFFVITDNYQIMVDATQFSAYGAGIPEPEGDQKITVYDNMVEISNLHRIVDPYKLFVGTTADHTITIGEESTIHFIDLVPAQTPLTVDIRRVSVLNALFV